MSEEDDGQRRDLLRDVLDEIIPASEDGRFPGAGRLGVGERLTTMLAERPELEPLFEAGLASIRRRAEERDAAGFGALPRSERVAVLREVEASEPAFFGIVLMQAYLGYYSHRQVADLLGVQSPPQPDGYDLEPGDLSLLDPVRRRPPMYREAPSEKT
ncbi:MAG: gluconate 2-dehydrogenase subunit 3 family protein [Planctomycetota bacterium]|jgi:hypothetical protein